MSEHTTIAGIDCRDLSAEERTKLEGVGEAIAGRFAAAGHAVHGCQPQGEGSYRLLLFIGADGRGVGAIPAAKFLTVPDERAAGAVDSWVVIR